jgi:hypothetical protein
MPPAEFETVIPASERPQTHALDCAATGIGSNSIYEGESNENFKSAIKIRNIDRLSCKLTTMIIRVLRVADRWQYFNLRGSIPFCIRKIIQDLYITVNTAFL